MILRTLTDYLLYLLLCDNFDGYFLIAENKLSNVLFSFDWCQPSASDLAICTAHLHICLAHWHRPSEYCLHPSPDSLEKQNEKQLYSPVRHIFLGVFMVKLPALHLSSFRRFFMLDFCVSIPMTLFKNSLPLSDLTTSSRLMLNICLNLAHTLRESDTVEKQYSVSVESYKRLINNNNNHIVVYILLVLIDSTANQW